MVEKVIIIGSGPAGLSAAIYCSREGFEPLVIGGFITGGQLILTTVVENFPGFPDGVDGPEIVALMRKQAVRFGTRFVDQDVTAVDLSSRPFKISTSEKTYEAECVIVATGASSKLLDLESEKKFMGKGVSTCGTCDGPFFKNKNVIVVGGGDTAMEDSLFLTKFASSVTIMHRRDAFRSSNIMQERVLANKKIKVIWNSAIDEITGGEHVTGVRIKNLLTNQISYMPIDGVFIAIGYIPNTKLFQGKLALDKDGYIITKEEVKTEIEGLYIAGDVADKFYRQAATASASGVKCALQVREYLSKLYYERSKKA